MISVIGAGPAGSYYASKEKNDEVHIFEEHDAVGKPVSCTGILTSAVNKLVKIPKDAIVSMTKQYKIIAPNKEELYVKLKEKEILLNRRGFDQHIAELAMNNGAKLHLKEKFLGFKHIGKSQYKIKTSKRSYDTNIIVGADGPMSQVAKSAGLYGNRKFIHGWQIRCRYKGLEEGTTTVFLNKGEFSWVVPEDDKIARVGVIGRDLNQMKAVFKDMVGNNKVIENQHGAVPLYNPKQKIRDGNVFLIGDAATHVKASTYGGIIYGMMAGKILAEDKENFVKNIKKDIGKDLWVSLKIRDAINKMSDDNMNRIVEIFQSEKNKKFIGSVDRNFPTKFAFHLALKEPRLWPLGLKALKNMVF